MIRRAYDALLLDLDGTLLTDEGIIRPRNLAALKALDASGVRVMVCTGRSEMGALEVLDQLGFDTPAVVFNGAGVWCTRTAKLVEERLLSNRTVERTMAFAELEGIMAMVMRSGEKFAPSPRTEAERSALRDMEALTILNGAPLPTEFLIRVTIFSDRHADSAELATELEAHLDQPAYMTHFPLNALPNHRASELNVVDVQPPCRGKAEALRVLQETYGISAERTVAVGDASNDVPMLREAGLGVAMRSGMQSALDAADEVIGHNNSDAIAELIERIF